MSKFFRVVIIPPAAELWTKRIDADDHVLTTRVGSVHIDFISKGVVIEQLAIPDTFGYSLALIKCESD